jgi:uncharacterized membrane protein YccC
MSLATRRAFRLGLTMALSLAVAYALAFPLPYLAPLFALFLTAKPGPPMDAKKLLVVLLLISLTLGVGLLLTPLLTHYPVSAILLVAVGVYLSAYLTVGAGKALFGTLLTVGFTLISAAGSIDAKLASAVIDALLLAVGLAVVCSWVVYPLFPEDDVATGPRPDAGPAGSDARWIALRSTLIVWPAYLLVLTNPGAYLPIIMKSVSLSQQANEVSARDAGRELLGSTFLAGCLAILFWFLLGLAPNLWMFFWWMLLFGACLAAKLYRAIGTRLQPSFWQNVIVTMLILLGPAVQDSANGDDVYAAFAARMSLFVFVTLYAWAAIVLLERLRNGRKKNPSSTDSEACPC